MYDYGSCYFYTEKSSRFINNPDYVPSVFIFSNTTCNKDKKSRYERLLKRRRKQHKATTEKRCKRASKHVNLADDEMPDLDLDQAVNDVPSMMVTENSGEDVVTEENVGNEQDVDSSEDVVNATEEQNVATKGENKSIPGSADKSLSTDIDSTHWYTIEKKLADQQKLIEMLQFELRATRPAEKLQNDDKQVHFYTGLPSYAVFSALLDLLVGVMSKHLSHGLSVSDQFLLVLMKLRLGIPNQDLAYRFSISPSRVSQLFHEWINVMARELGQLIQWPHREIIRKNLPDCFKTTYPRTTCIIDCSEIFIERATSLSARSQTYSNYKSHNTAKFLIAISPTGAVIFISKCWGGRASDKHITSQCGFLDLLINGDMVMADRGFDITEDLALRGTSLCIPPFTKGKSQLSQREVETSRVLSSLRIHVERAIGRIKNYKILQHVFPISLLKSCHDNDFAMIDKVLIVCASLCNLQSPLV